MGAFMSRQNAAVEEAENVRNLNQAYRYPPRSGNFFGSHFIMGGERFDTPQPESYLFGENADLNLLGNRPTAFPYPPPQANEPTKTLKSLVNIRKESVRFVRVAQEKCMMETVVVPICLEHGQDHLDGSILCSATIACEDALNAVLSPPPCSYQIEFIFDSDAKCAITIYYFATEEVSPSGVTLTPRDGFTSETYHYEKGINQFFSQPSHIFNPQLIPEDDLGYNPGREQYPVAIHCVVEEGNEECRQSHTTICVIDHHPETNSYVLRALKQKIFVDGLCYLLQEIYGIENKAVNKSSIDEDIDDHGSECVICMSETRDTLILPCRHLCLCNSCADSLRYQANNCPICRAPFRALLQIRAVQKGMPTHALHQNTPTSATGEQSACDQHVPSGYIPVSLIEALNGPPQYVARIRQSDGDVPDSGPTVGGGGGIGITPTSVDKGCSPPKSNIQRRPNSRSRKNASTSTNTVEMDILTGPGSGHPAAQSIVEVVNDVAKLTPLVEQLQEQGSLPRNSGGAQDKVHIVNERSHSLKLPKSKRNSVVAADNDDDNDADSENEKLSPLLSPGSRSMPPLSAKSRALATSENTGLKMPACDSSDHDADDACDGEIIIVSIKQPATFKKHKRASDDTAAITAGDSGNNSATTGAGVVIANGVDDSDYYSPEDTQNSMLSPLCPDRAKSASDKLGSLKSGCGGGGAGSFKSSNSLAKKNLHKKSTSVGNIVGPAGAGDIKGNSSLPDMLDSPISGNSASTRSSSDSYSSSSSTKQLLSSNAAAAAVTNIIGDDKTALQNAVNV